MSAGQPPTPAGDQGTIAARMPPVASARRAVADARDPRAPQAAAPELIPARMVNAFVYCPRLFYLEWVHGEFQHSVDTLEGKAVHRRVDREAGQLPPPDDAGMEAPFQARSVLLSAPRLGLIARMDLLEGEGGTVMPVDYKKGAPGSHGPWEPDKVQLCVQGLILRDNGYVCDAGEIYYAATKQRFAVAFDNALVETTLAAIAELRRIAAGTTAPPPLVDSPKCPRCSLVGICLPDEVNLLRGARSEDVRRLVPARDEACPLYVVSQGAVVGKSGERLKIRRSGEPDTHVRLIDVSHIALFGSVSISAQALRTLADHGIPILHFTYGGWLTAVTSGPAPKNVLLRTAQYRHATQARRALAIAQAIVAGKIRNQRTLLRRNHRERPRTAIAELARLAHVAQRVRSIAALLGAEGTAARLYFSHFSGMLSPAVPFDFAERTRRPPTDPVNAVLSYLYALLTKDCTVACLAAGLDPYLGFFHQIHYGRPSLALDLAEEFRPLIADSVAITLFNSQALDARDFVQRGPACALSTGARQRVIQAYETRMQTLIRHPVFGYAVSYRRVVEVQARLLARTVLGEVRTYRPFTTR
jgi:CRISPR-associated protein Cas1